MNPQQKSALHDIHSIVTAQFIALLEKDIIPWHISWAEHPQFVNGWPFDHINIWLVAHLNYPRNVFLTGKQIRRLRARVKQGERGHPTVGIRHGTLRPAFYCSEVYNIQQLEGIYNDELPSFLVARDPMKQCASIVSQMPKLPFIVWDESSAYYSVKSDTILLREQEHFDSEEQYYSTLFYVLAQSTGHQTRRNRTTCIHSYQNDPKTYSCEDLIVEMAASYICAYAGIKPWYLKECHGESKGWIKSLQMDSTIVITAAMYAQESVNYILNRSPLLNPIQTGIYTPRS
jgi:antirestriction protein ArdC